MPKHDDDSLWGKSTHRSLIMRAGGARPGARREAAWRELIARYERPIRVCLQRHVRGHPDAEALVADFFGYLFERDVLARFDPAKGRFRAFIQGVIRNFVRARRRREAARGGSEAELELLCVDLPPEAEREEERAWARALLDQAARELLARHRHDGGLLLRYYGVPPHEPTDVATLADELGMSANAVHQALHRGRRALRSILEREVRDLAATEADYQAEKDALIGRLIRAQPGLLG